MRSNPQMHPRNKYKSPPDFTQLAIKYPQFREVSTMDLEGKVKVDFKNEKTIRMLTKHLLKEDFHLDVEIPENYLVPTLPLRLNYILWLEDICSVLHLTHPTGVDIGCGAVCIYPILAAAKNKWKMLAVETNQESIKYARLNVSKNHLESLVKIHHQPDKQKLLSHIAQLDDFQDGVDFCMCNPPFFSSTADLDNNNRVNRTGRRAPPKTVITGNTGELVGQGGEVAFIQRLIEESLVLKDKVKVFTTMLGHKSSVDALINYLRADNIINYTQTEFCQGNTTRWGLAWTHRWDLLLRRVPVFGSKATLEQMKGFRCEVPSSVGKFEDIVKSLDGLFKLLKLRILENTLETNKVTFIVCAYDKTWANQRKKRRELKRLLDNSTESIDDASSSNKKSKTINEDNQLNEVIAKRVERTPILVASVQVVASNDSSKFGMEMIYLNGETAKDGVHQVFQFIINKWKES